MHMLQAGVDITVIALWLGHENPATTHMYVEADLAMKERALQAVQPPHIKHQGLKTRPRPTLDPAEACPAEMELHDLTPDVK